MHAAWSVLALRHTRMAFLRKEVVVWGFGATKQVSVWHTVSLPVWTCRFVFNNIATKFEDNTTCSSLSYCTFCALALWGWWPLDLKMMPRHRWSLKGTCTHILKFASLVVSTDRSKRRRTSGLTVRSYTSSLSIVSSNTSSNTNSCCTRGTASFKFHLVSRCSVLYSTGPPITGSAVALHCCKVHAKINRKMGNSTPCKIVTPENIILKLCIRD